jgi:hypothetical protein
MAKALTQLTIDNFKPGPARRELPDGKERGLYLVVQPTGGMTWAFRYRDHGRTCKLTFGAYPAIGLAKARAEAARAKVALADGDDPAAAKRAARAAKRVLKSADDHVERVIADFISLYANQRPVIGKRPSACSLNLLRLGRVARWRTLVRRISIAFWTGSLREALQWEQTEPLRSSGKFANGLSHAA